MLGDGCAVCNPSKALQYLDEDAYRAHVRAVVSEYLAVMEEWRRLTAPRSQWSPPRNVNPAHPVIQRLRAAQAKLAELSR